MGYILANTGLKDVTRTLIGDVYSYVHVLPDRFLFKLRNLIRKETRRAEHEYININTPINILGPVVSKAFSLNGG